MQSQSLEVVEDSVQENNLLSSSSKLTKDIYGIFGQIQFATGAYLILIEEASLIGELLQIGSSILRVDKLMYIPLSNPSVPIKV